MQRMQKYSGVRLKRLMDEEKTRRLGETKVKDNKLIKTLKDIKNKILNVKPINIQPLKK